MGNLEIIRRFVREIKIEKTHIKLNLKTQLVRT